MALRDFRSFNRPNAEFQPCFYEGVHYRWMLKSDVEQIVESYLECTEEADRPRLAFDLMMWQRGLLQNEQHVFFPDSRPWARNTAVLVGINMDSFSPFHRKVTKATTEQELATTRIPQLIKAVPLLEIYLTNRAGSIDPMHIVWIGESIVVPDLKFLDRQENRLPECVPLPQVGNYGIF